MNLDLLDPVLVLTPLLVLAVVLLLGFAGCHVIFRLDPVVEPTPPPLTFRVRVPKALEVRKITFLWDAPSTVGDGKTLPLKPTPSGLDGDDYLYDHALSGQPDLGAWTAECEVVLAAGPQGGSLGTGTFTLDGSVAEPVATFQATGDATNLAVTFVGVTEGAMV